MGLNDAEKRYSLYGPMKMAAIAKRHLVKGSELKINDFHFCRTSQATEVSQIDLLESLGKNLVKDVKINEVINWDHIRDK